MERIIAIDSGKFATKAAMQKANGEIKMLSFRSKMDQKGVSGVLTTSESKTFSVEYEGKKYIVGEGAETSDDSNTTKNDEFHKILTYAAIAQLVDNGDVVTVSVGCPLYIYNNAEASQKYKDSLLPKGRQINITVAGVEKMFVIKKGMVFPEGAGVILLNSTDPDIRDEIVGVIDIGGLNCNCCIYKKLTPITLSMFTNNLGGNIMTNNIRQRLEEEFAGDMIRKSIMEQAIPRGFINGTADVKERSKRVIAEGRKDHIKAILADCAERQWNVKMMPVIFTGGTSYLLKNEIAEACETAQLDLITEDIAFANVKGFLRIMTGK